MRTTHLSVALALVLLGSGCGTPAVIIVAPDGGPRPDGGDDAQAPPGCGDGRREAPEACDDGNTVAGDGCDAVCRIESGWTCDGEPTRCRSTCGDGIRAGDEACDDGNTVPEDGCNTACGVEAGYSCEGEPSVCVRGCGDGTVTAPDECDDGDTDDGDGCSSACAVEAGWTCSGAPSACTTTCGDGLVRGTEGCDDGARVPGDGCSATCAPESGYACAGEPSVCMLGCGDGVVDAMEECDDGARTPGDGCDASCREELGWDCTGAPSDCAPVCGDGILAGGEGCDDGDADPGDGCSGGCVVERGFGCVGEMPSVCSATCGDAIVATTEECDDGDLDAGDGCGPTCLAEFAYGCVGEPSVCLRTDQAVAVSLGDRSGCVRTMERRVRCWGENLQGAIGDGTRDPRFLPATASVDRVIALDVGGQFACAVRDDGAVWCWGSDSSQQQGPGITSSVVTVPGPVPGLASMVAIATGREHVCARDAAGAVWCWGDNDNAQLARGGTGRTDSDTPMIVTTSETVTQLASGGDHTCVVLSGGGVECWGDDGQGQLGDGGTNTDQSLPVGVIGLTGVAQVAAGNVHTCARTTAGLVRCWGDNARGQLGDGGMADSPIPVAVALPGMATWIGAGAMHTCAIVDGRPYCWGENAQGQLGDGTRVFSRMPIPVGGLAGTLTFSQLDGGERGTCGMAAGGERYCWGEGDLAQLGILEAQQREPVAAMLSGTIARVAGARPRRHATYCAARSAGSVACWGSSDTNLLFDPTGADAPAAREMGAALSGVVELAMGDDFACARTATEVQCWGENSQRQLGQGTSTTDVFSPTPVAPLAGGSVVELALGRYFACARMVAGEVRCWGDAASRQVGMDTTTDSGTPTAITGVSGATSIAAGENHACAVTAAGVVQCWGDDAQGQLGDGSPGGARPDAQPVMGLGPATQVAVGRDHSCALLTSGRVSCWGENGLGQVGDGGTVDRPAPREVTGLLGIVQIAAGWDHTCARRSDDTVACWGAGADGQLGSGFTPSGTTTYATTALDLAGVTGAVDLAATATSTCVRDAGGVRCVGFHSFGQLADGDTLRPLTPLAAPL